MLPPKRERRRCTCDGCLKEHRTLVLGRLTTNRQGKSVLYIRNGNGTMVTDAATANECIVVCAHGHSSVFHVDTVIWGQEWEHAA
jgi:hypothetical protein